MSRNKEVSMGRSLKADPDCLQVFTVTNIEVKSQRLLFLSLARGGNEARVRHALPRVGKAPIPE